ncbi:hypothetical protein J437_LFUL001052, partial [Ladona fulva]
MFASVSDQMLCIASTLGPSPKINIIGLSDHVLSADTTVPPAATLLHTINLVEEGGLKGNVNLMSISVDGKYLAVSDISGNISIWNSDTWKIVEWSINSKKYSKFCRKLMQQGLPKKWVSRSFPVTGISFDMNKQDVLILHDDSTITIIDKS